MNAIRTVPLALATLAGLSGCGDRLGQGDRVVLVDEKFDYVFVGDMSEHTPANPRIATFKETGGTVNSETVATGTRATVVSDSADAEFPGLRPVKILLLDPPYQGVTGTVSRSNLRRE
jgi:hypothetical protein